MCGWYHCCCSFLSSARLRNCERSDCSMLNLRSLSSTFSGVLFTTMGPAHVKNMHVYACMFIHCTGAHKELTLNSHITTCTDTFNSAANLDASRWWGHQRRAIHCRAWRRGTWWSLGPSESRITPRTLSMLVELYSYMHSTRKECRVSSRCSCDRRWMCHSRLLLWHRFT